VERADEKTILVVDDEPNVRQYLKAILEDAGFHVVTAEDGEIAMRIIKERRPDFISLDLIMPRKSGHRLLFELKRDKELARIPVMIVTAHAKDDMGRDEIDDLLEKRMMSGPGAYLEKPVDPTAYVHCIQRALGIEAKEGVTDRISLREELSKEMQGAGTEELRKALELLKKRGTK